MAILISTNPPYSDLLVGGIKEIEWRKCPLPCGVAFIYETKKGGGCGAVIGQVWILGYVKLPPDMRVPPDYARRGCVDEDFIRRYANGKAVFANIVTHPVRYKEPRPLSDFISRSKTGCVNMGKCRGCQFLDRGNGYNIEDDCLADFDTDAFAPMRRPPQSWCYVKEV